ncbi:MAG: FAD-dependent oxidoreductase [Haliscomenobacter sp.]|nr:FAD-dependent oxidoreductase [Haliscomenobacter sp.]MBK9492697.1 FAD-dependent oxidoreductase [Haliscomenobacter sp.]
MKKAIIIGGGIIGLSSAYYLRRAGWDITVIDKGNRRNNCSTGNAGYICPSHFVPLATPGIVAQGMKWMLNSRSPFYVQPRLSWPLIQWGIQFMRSATAQHVQASARPLRDIALFSMACYEDLKKEPGFDFFYAHDGMLEAVQTTENVHHAKETAAQARDLGLDAEWLDKDGVKAIEPDVEMNIRGATWFRCDAHCNPEQLVQNLEAYLRQQGATLLEDTEVTGFQKQNGAIREVITKQGVYSADLVVLATGSWSREMAAKIGLSLPLVAGRGYSFLSDASDFPLRRPVILTEGRVAVSPFAAQIRFGGTMEITAINTPPRYKRVEGIVQSAREFFPQLKLEQPKEADVWYGYRPCSADGLPYIGRLQKTPNVIVATGHSMLGLSLGAGTGKLVAELAEEQATNVDLGVFAPERFE